MTFKNSLSRLALLLAFIVAGTTAVRAQQRYGGASSSRSSSSYGASSANNTASSTREYPNSTLPGDATFTYDPETHSIIVMTDDKTFEHIQNVVSNLDKPKPQALIKVVFLEVQHDNALDFGVQGTFETKKYNLPQVNSSTAASDFGLNQLGSAGQTIGQTTMPTGQGIYSIMGSDFQATIRAIASAQKVEVLSRPSIMVRNNQPANITVGQSVPIVTGVTFPTINSGPLSTITYQNVGIILQVTPFISKDGMVEMIVAPQISELSSQQVQVSSNVFAPVIDLRSASTVVVTPDGETVVIGGLMENDKTVIDSKIPVLGDIPVLGVLFKHKQQAITKKELLIFLTPHIVKMPDQMASITSRENKNATMSHQAFTEDEWDRYFDRLPVKKNVFTSTNGPAK